MDNVKIINEWKKLKEDCVNNEIHDKEEMRILFEFKLKIEGILL